MLDLLLRRITRGTVAVKSQLTYGLCNPYVMTLICVHILFPKQIA